MNVGNSRGQSRKIGIAETKGGRSKRGGKRGEKRKEAEEEAEERENDGDKQDGRRIEDLG